MVFKMLFFEHTQSKTALYIIFYSITYKVNVPEECLPRFSRNDLELMPGFLNDMNEERPEVRSQYATKCIYEEGIVYNDGDQWKATHEACKMCSCKR